MEIDGTSFLLTALGMLFGAAFGYYFYRARLQIEDNKKEILEMKNEMNDIRSGSKEFLVQSMRDKKEGIQFFENPCFAKWEKRDEVHKIKKEIRYMKKRINRYNTDIGFYEEKSVKLGKQVSKIKTKFENRLVAAQEQVRNQLFEEDGLF